jgi:glycine hydroxymethyltransferase
MGEAEMEACAGLVDGILGSLRVKGEREYELDPEARGAYRSRVAELCARFPIPHYPPPSA